MNRIRSLFAKKRSGILSIFTTAGYPQPEDTIPVARALEEAGADMIEIGIPFSDPVADGPVIQESSAIALKNGMNIRKLFRQLEDLRPDVTIPVILMGYLNPILQFGIKAFLEACKKVGIDGLIVPDLPLKIYQSEWRSLCEEAGIPVIFLVTQETGTDRIYAIDKASNAFIYLATSAGTTGGGLAGDESQRNYLEKIKGLNLNNPVLAGFGIRSRRDIDFLGQYTNGVIIGSHFIRGISSRGTLKEKVATTLREITG